MPIFNFDHFQLHQMTVAASSVPQENSPLLISSVAALSGVDNPSVADASLEELLQSGLIIRYKGKLQLAPELEPLFFILTNPDRVWRFYRQARVDEGETYFCWKDGVGVQLVIQPAYSGYQLLYPHSPESADKWFTHEFMADLMPKATRFEPVRIYADHTEMLLMSVMQQIYTHRARHLGILDADQRWIHVDELKGFRDWDQLPEIVSQALPQSDLEFFFSRSGALAGVVASLAVKDLIEISEDSVRISELGVRMFSPGKMLDMIQVFDYGDGDRGNTIRSMAVLEDGYLLQQPAAKGDRVRMELLPGNLPPEELLGKLVRVKYLKPAKKAVKKRTAKLDPVSRKTEKAKRTPTEQRPKKARKPAEKHFCRSCGSELKDKAAFCRSCGTAAKPPAEPEKRFCRNCGNELREGSVFCPKCGHKNA